MGHGGPNDLDRHGSLQVHAPPSIHFSRHSPLQCCYMLLSSNHAAIDQIRLEEMRLEEFEFKRQYRLLDTNIHCGRHLESQVPPDLATSTRYYTWQWQYR